MSYSEAATISSCGDLRSYAEKGIGALAATIRGDIPEWMLAVAVRQRCCFEYCDSPKL